VGLFSSVAVFADMSRHPALVVKRFEDSTAQTDTFIYTRLGWMNLIAPGFMRAAGKYSHEVFPLDVFLANPWVDDQEVGDYAAEHRKKFREALPELKMKKYEPPRRR
jgi:hypothetical protein